jgi:hypothetical protein
MSYTMTRYVELEDRIGRQQPTIPLVELVPTLSSELFCRQVQYAVIVELWDKTKFGRVKRAFEETFTEEERRTIEQYYDVFRRWHLQEGTPDRVAVRPGTLQLLQRAVQFFGEI